MFRKSALVLALCAAIATFSETAFAHCDTLDGPVVSAARQALQSGDVTPVLKWVKAADEPQIRAAFAQTLKVRASGPEARQLADTWFFETLVRVHRSGEGEPFTGLKPAGAEVEPGILLADKALESGSDTELVRQVTAGMGESLRRRFARVQESSKHAEESLEAGRRYVAAYVNYIHYVERVHQLLAGTVEDDHASVHQH